MPSWNGRSGSTKLRQKSKSRAIITRVIIAVGVAYVGLFMLYPGSPPRTPNLIMANLGNVRHIGRAIKLHDQTYGDQTGPSEIVKYRNGQPLLSWRVHLLPFLEHDALYAKFNLDESWDSPHNIKLLDEMPGYYACPYSSHSNDLRHRTVYVIPTPQMGAIDSNGKFRFRDFFNNESGAVIVAQVPNSMAIEWTRPDVRPFDAENLRRTVEGIDETFFTVAFSDGRTDRIRFERLAENWKTLLERSGENTLYVE